MRALPIFLATIAVASAEETPLLGINAPNDEVLIRPHLIETIATGVAGPV